MQHDKKALGGRVCMVLPTGLGKVDIYDDIAELEVAQGVTGLLK